MGVGLVSVSDPARKDAGFAALASGRSRRRAVWDRECQNGLFELLGRLLGPAQVARGDFTSGGLAEWSRLDAQRLRALLSLSPSAAQRLEAAFDLGRRVRELRTPKRPVLRTPGRVMRVLEERVRGCSRETFYTLLLDGKHALRRIEVVSVGTLTCSLVHPREVFRPALREAAAAIVCAHNHPSGDPEPSAEDVEVTRRLVDAGKLLGVPLLDHVVLGEGRWVSLRERMGF